MKTAVILVQTTVPTQESGKFIDLWTVFFFFSILAFKRVTLQ